MMRAKKILLTLLILIHTLSSAKDQITLINETNKSVFAACYYAKNEKYEIVGNPQKIDSAATIIIERPPRKRTYDRQLICSYNIDNLISFQVINAETAKKDIDRLQGETFHVAQKKEQLKIYDTVDWRLKHLKDSIDNKLAERKEQYMHYPYADLPAIVTRTTAIGTTEKNFQEKRTPFVQDALENLFTTTLSKDNVPCIAVAMSGGGMRAAICSYALFLGLFDLKLINTLRYAVALSGSTWFLSQWLLSGLSLPALHDPFYTALTKPSLISISDLNEQLLQKALFGEHISIVDLYGVYLANTFFNFVPQHDRQKPTITDLQQRIADAQWPFPLFTSGETTEDFYWCTFTPYEFSCSSLAISIPTWSFGRFFNQGTTTDNSPQQSLGFLMGLWGSALSGSLEEMLEASHDSLNSYVYNALYTLLLDKGINDMRPAAIKIGNPLYHVPDAIYAKNRELIFVDGGYGCNIPLVPLVHPERHPDIIFVLDASENVHDGAPDFMRALDQVRNLGIAIPQINIQEILQQPVSIIENNDDPTVPTIIYVPPVKNDRYDPSFDPAKTFSKNYATARFIYNENAVDKLLNLIRFNIVDNQKIILKSIAQKLNNKKGN